MLISLKEAHEMVEEETKKLNTLALMLEEVQHIPPEDYSEWIQAMMRIASKKVQERE